MGNSGTLVTGYCKNVAFLTDCSGRHGVYYFVLVVCSFILLFFFSCFFSLFAGKSLFTLFLEQFDDLLVKILLAAAVVSFVSHISYLLCLVVSCGVRQMESGSL